MSEFWDNRYSSDNYIYGTKPNSFIKSFIDSKTPGSILFPAEGEGRNAVYAASKDWKVTAFDTSKVAKQKADNLAIKNSVELDYRTTDIFGFSQKYKFDVIAICYLHLYENERITFHKELLKHLSVGGYLILECYSKEHTNTSGPNDIDMLYDLNEIIDDFSELKIEFSASKKVIQDEGKHHQRTANIIQVIAQKVK